MATKESRENAQGGAALPPAPPDDPEDRTSMHDAADTDEAADDLQSRQRSRSRPMPTSLSSIRAFEAVARRQSFTKAATELHLTQTAVSHQVRKLESRLRAQLFIRDREGARLSEAGRHFLPAVQSALDTLSSATQRVLDRNDETSLSIVSLAAFGLKCLLPLLPDFRRRYPYIRIRFGSVISYDAGADHDYHVSIRYGSGDWPGMTVFKVAEEHLFPVCSPKFLTQAQLTKPEDMIEHTLITTTSQAFRDDWPEWLAPFNQSPDDFRDVISCDTMLAATQAAIDGLGLAIGRTPLVNHDLREGRLIEPFRKRLPSATGYYITCAPEYANRQSVRFFIDWLLGHFKESSG